MNLLDLPLEMGALIFKYLDIKSKIKAYSIYELRKFFVASLMRKFDVSRSSAASVETLNLDVFKDLAANIYELNLSGITDLTACQLSPHIQRCSNLKTLDITFTNIYLSDLAELCPDNLKNINVNFFKWPRNVKGKDVWKRSIELFQRKRFENIHFIVSAMDSGAPLLFMNDVSRTKSLKITVANNYNREFQDHSVVDHYYRQTPPTCEGNMIAVNFEKLNYVFRDCVIDFFHNRPCVVGVSNLDFKQIEYMLLIELSFIRPNMAASHEIDFYIYVSPIFGSLFAKNFSNLQIEVATHLPSNMPLGGNIVLKAWHKSFTDFNDAFFKTVLTELKDHFPTYVCMHNKMEMKLTQAPSNWYCIDACEGFERTLDKLPENVILTDFCRKEGHKIEIKRPVYLTPLSNTLKNITYLRLSNICLREDFFTTLFNQCKNLKTLVVDIINRDFQRCPLSLHLTKSLKNLKLTSRDIEYASLCQCPTLENIDIREFERTIKDGIDKHMLLLIEKCPDVYSLRISPDMRPEDMTSLKTSLRLAAQQFKRHHLFIEVSRSGSWNPFADVFNPSPLNILY